jgi:arginine:agmatine antiporter
VLIAGVSYILSCTAIMGMLPNQVLQKSSAPFGDAAKLVLGEWGGALVSICAAAGCLGSLGGWTLVVGQTAKAAADDGLFPEIFGRANAKGVPALGLIIVATMMSVLMLITISPSASQQFGVISSIAVIMTLLPYIYTVSALRELGEPHFGTAKVLWHAVILVAIVYSAWAIVGSDAKQVLWTMVVTLLTTLVYARTLARRVERSAAAVPAAAVQ